MYFAYRGISVLVLAPLMALFASLFDPGAPLLATYTQVFMPALGRYLLQYFPVFLLGSIFGKLMSDSGAAAVIGKFVAKQMRAERGLLAVVLACGLLTYGEVSLFVVAFCVYPVAASLFKEGDIPRRLIPGAIALGSFTFSMTGLPGTPAIQNAIPMPYFGTTAFAAPGLGLVGAVVMFGLGYSWLHRRSVAARAGGEGYGAAGDRTVTGSSPQSPDATFPVFLKALTPLAMVVALNWALSKWILPGLDHAYLAEERFGGVSPESVVGLWALISAIFAAIVLHLFLYRKQLKDAVRSVNEGTMGSLLPIFNTASEVGYGAVIASLSSFIIIKESVLGLAPQYPLVSEAISINILAGVTGSASGGLSIALEALAENYLQLAASAGISPDLLHRVASMASGGFDTLPHNGAVITLLTICGLTHRQSYVDIGVVSVAGVGGRSVRGDVRGCLDGFAFWELLADCCFSVPSSHAKRNRNTRVRVSQRHLVTRTVGRYGRLSARQQHGEYSLV